MQLVKLFTFAAAFAGFAIAKPVEGGALDEPTPVPSAPGTDAKNRKYDRDYNRKYDHEYNRQYDREYNRHYDREYNRQYDIYYPEYPPPPPSTVTTIIITVTPSDYVYAATPTAAL